jgi:sterol desaturase/sphingolipid hydroxylase (fatty acid hydroxylase superfamily)
MTSVAGPAVGATIGAVGWTFSEYAFHRWFHVARDGNFARRTHLAHHARQEYLVNSVSVLTWGAMLFVGLAVLPLLLWSAVPGAVALAFGVAWVAAYFVYEWIHAADHLRPPRNAYGRWTRRSHFHHHYEAPLRNFGVTTPIWDLVFGTYDPVSQVAVPRRLAPVWLIDDLGGLKGEFADSYFVRGRPIPARAVVAAQDLSDGTAAP